jgi:hypothetical protein
VWKHVKEIWVRCYQGKPPAISLLVYVLKPNELLANHYLFTRPLFTCCFPSCSSSLLSKCTSGPIRLPFLLLHRRKFSSRGMSLRIGSRPRAFRGAILSFMMLSGGNSVRCSQCIGFMHRRCSLDGLLFPHRHPASRVHRLRWTDAWPFRPSAICYALMSC